MADLDDAITEAAKTYGARNRLEVILEEMDPDDARKLAEVYLPDRNYSTPQIVRALATLGYRVHRSSVDNWRAKHGY